MIRKFVQSALCLCLVHLLTAQQSVREPNAVRLPKGTAIQLKLDQDVSSAAIHKGDQVRYTVDENVVVDGATVISAGTIATRRVTSAQVSRPNEPCSDANNGSFELSDSVFLSINGPQIKLTAESPQLHSQDAMTPGEKVLFAVLFPPQFAGMLVFAAVDAPIELVTNLHDRLHRPPPPPPCPAKTHEMQWKASEAKSITYYLLHNYTVRASLPISAPEATKEAQ